MIVTPGSPWVSHLLSFAMIMLLFNAINLGMAQLFCYLWEAETCEHGIKGSLLTFVRNVDYGWGLVVGFIYAWFHHCDVHVKH